MFANSVLASIGSAWVIIIYHTNRRVCTVAGGVAGIGSAQVSIIAIFQNIQTLSAYAEVIGASVAITRTKRRMYAISKTVAAIQSTRVEVIALFREVNALTACTGIAGARSTIG